MARPLRIEFPGAVYHVTSRGNARSDIFDDAADRELFLKILVQVVRRFNWLCHAYCLMDNHYHLLIETPEGNLSAGMRQLNGVYTQAYNRAHDRDGHIFKGRFKAVLVEKENHLLELCRYVVLNPVRAGMVTWPEDYPWSSYLPTLGQAPLPGCLTADWILGNFGLTLPEARQHYRQFVIDGMAQESSPWTRLSGQVLLGSAEFVRQARDQLGGKDAISEIPRVQRNFGRPALVALFPPEVRRPKAERNRLIREAHVDHAYTLKEIAQALDLHYTTVSKVVNCEEHDF